MNAKLCLNCYLNLSMDVVQVNFCLDALNVPTDLSYEERLTYYRVFVKESI